MNCFLILILIIIVIIIILLLLLLSLLYLQTPPHGSNNRERDREESEGEREMGMERGRGCSMRLTEGGTSSSPTITAMGMSMGIAMGMGMEGGIEGGIEMEKRRSIERSDSINKFTTPILLRKESEGREVRMSDGIVSYRIALHSPSLFLLLHLRAYILHSLIP